VAIATTNSSIERSRALLNGSKRHVDGTLVRGPGVSQTMCFVRHDVAAKHFQAPDVAIAYESIFAGSNSSLWLLACIYSGCTDANLRGQVRQRSGGKGKRQKESADIRYRG
jgi:hypothetical protein